MTLRYFITFVCYGAHLHGHESGSVDQSHNMVGSPSLEPNAKRVIAARQKMRDDSFTLDQTSRATVLSAMQNVCVHRGWTFLAAHVRTNHVHAVIEAETQPERIMADFKSYASRALNRMGDGDRKRWARHGSTRRLWKDEEVRRAVKYVIEQGQPMAWFVVDGL